MESSSLSKHKFLYSVLFGFIWVVGDYVGMGALLFPDLDAGGYHMIQWSNVTDIVQAIGFLLQEILIWTVGLPFSFPYYVLTNLFSFMADDKIGREALQTGLTFIVPLPVAIFLVFQGWSIKEKYFTHPKTEITMSEKM